MGQIVSVDVKHSLGATEAEQRVRAGIEALRAKYGHYLTQLDIQWGEGRADAVIGAMGQTLKGALEFYPEVVRVSIELPWMLAMMAEKAKGLMTKHTDQALALPPPKA